MRTESPLKMRNPKIDVLPAYFTYFSNVYSAIAGDVEWGTTPTNLPIEMKNSSSKSNVDTQTTTKNPVSAKSSSTNPFGRDSLVEDDNDQNMESPLPPDPKNGAHDMKDSTTNPFGRDSIVEEEEKGGNVAKEHLKKTPTPSSVGKGPSPNTKYETPTLNPFGRDTMPDDEEARDDLPSSPSKPPGNVKTAALLSSSMECDESGENCSVNNKSSGDLYHAVHFGSLWMYVAIILHLLQFCFLLGIGSSALHPAALAIQILLVLAVPILLMLARIQSRPAHAKSLWSSDAMSVQQETDIVPDSAIYLLCSAALLEGLACAIYPSASARSFDSDDNDDDTLSGSGFRSYQTMGQILSFASITFYSFHRIIRPANRLDPLRTLLELEAVSMCWDALDGASLYELLVESNPTKGDDDQSITSSADVSARFLMTFWYLSIGVRVAVMYSAHLSSESWLYKYLYSPPLTLSPKATVDRTLSAIRLKSLSTTLMATAQFFAAGLRISLWSSGDLSNLQQEMMIKNILFLLPVGGAILWTQSTKNRDWNTRDVFATYISCLNMKIDIKKPIRTKQLEILRYCFVISYVLVGALMSSLLIQVSEGGPLWCLNIVTDIALCALFLRACRAVHNTKAWVIFPKELASGLGAALLLNLFAARVPVIYWYAGDMDAEGEIWTYTNALLVVLASLVPIASYVMFWSVCNMLFHQEFTACPGQYNAIHDPGNVLVISSTMLEGALDIVSATSLLALAEASELPRSVDGAVIFFAFLELCNSCQSFMLLVQMSAGVNDTPGHLVKWRADVRMFGGLLDFGVLLLRVSIWIKYNTADSVFLVKNLCSLIQTVALVERARGIENYDPNEMFVNFVLPRDWYGIASESEWQKAIELPPDYK